MQPLLCCKAHLRPTLAQRMCAAWQMHWPLPPPTIAQDATLRKFEETCLLELLMDSSRFGPEA
jgi:hypothetical protein